MRRLAAALALLFASPSMAAVVTASGPFTGSVETVTGQNFPLIWKDEFKSLSLRSGGPLRAGYAAGKGTWSPHLWYMPGSGTYASGYPGFGFDLFVDPLNNGFSALDPNFPVLGMIDITDQGLIVKGSAGYPAVRQSLPVQATGGYADPTSNLLHGLSSWYSSSGSGATCTPVDSLPACYTVTSDVDYGGIEDYVASPGIAAGATYAGKVQFNFGTSGRAQFLIDSGNGQAVSVRVLSDGTVAAHSDAGSSTALGQISNATLATVGSHKEVTFTYTPAGTPGALTARAAPNSQAAGQAVTVYSFAFGPSTGSSKYTFLGALLSTIDSMNVAPPFYIEEVFVDPVDASQQSFVAPLWMLGSKTTANDTAKQFEVDINEDFGTDYGPNFINQTVHQDRATGPSYNTLTTGNAYNAGYSVRGNVTKVGAYVTTSSVTYFANGVQTSTVAVDASANAAQRMQAIIDYSVGYGYKGISAYPSAFAGGQLIVRSVAVYAPTSNTNYVLPPIPPVPVVTPRPAYAGGLRSTIPAGTVAADLSGCASYSVLVNGSPGFAVSGSTLVATSGLAAKGAHSMYVQCVDANGTPAIAPRIDVR